MVFSAPPNAAVEHWIEIILTSPALEWLREQIPVASLWYRPLIPNPSANTKPSLIYGQFEPQTLIQEHFIQYQVCIPEGYSPGFFADQRENRARLATWLKLRLARSGTASVLNCFAYTCSFSVTAASVGAKTTSVDISSKALRWGKDNFSINKLSLENHRFYAEDVMSYLPRAIRRKQKFDAIILDPPTFARSKRKIFRVEEKIPQLLELSLSCLSDGGVILLSTNCSKITSSDLIQIAKQTFGISQIESSPPPLDFRNSHHSSTIWIFSKNIH